MTLNTVAVGAVLALVVSAAIFFYVRNDMNKTRNVSAASDVLKAFATAVGGSYSYSGFGFKHTVKWEESGVPFELVRRSQDDPVSGNEASTTVESVLQPRGFAFELHAESRMPTPGAGSLTLGSRGGSPISTGVGELDSGYSTRASDTERARELLRQPQVWQALVALNAPGAYLDLSAHGAGVQIVYGDDVGTVSADRLMNIRSLFGAIIRQLKGAG